MSVDKFGRYRGRIAPARGPPGVGFVLTAEGDYNMRNKRMRNIKQPNDATDAATKAYVDKLHTENIRELKDVNLNIKGLIRATIPELISLKVNASTESLMKKIEAMDHNLANYMKSVDTSREDFEKFRQTIDQNTVNTGRALTELALKVNNLQK